jgi:hypothetical protein
MVQAQNIMLQQIVGASPGTVSDVPSEREGSILPDVGNENND